MFGEYNNLVSGQTAYKCQHFNALNTNEILLLYVGMAITQNQLALLFANKERLLINLFR